MNNTQIRNHFQRIVYKSKGVYQAQIALTNLCNAACVFCFRGNQDHTNEMSDEKLLELLYDLKGTPKNICFRNPLSFNLVFF